MKCDFITVWHRAFDFTMDQTNTGHTRPSLQIIREKKAMAMDHLFNAFELPSSDCERDFYSTCHYISHTAFHLCMEIALPHSLNP